MWKKLKNNNKKGFTLVELIVVLVILAILAALLIPALTGYIDKAKEKNVIAKTRQIVMASQTLLDEAYGKKKKSTTTISFIDDGSTRAIVTDDVITIGVLKGNAPDGSDEKITTVEGLSEVGVTATTVKIVPGNGTKGDIGKIYQVMYLEDGKLCTYTDGGDYVVTKATGLPSTP